MHGKTGQYDRRASSSSSTINQFGSVRTQGRAGHKDYLHNMLVNRLSKKFNVLDSQTLQTIKGEVTVFCQNEYVTKESMKHLEQRVARKLNQSLAE